MSAPLSLDMLKHRVEELKKGGFYATTGDVEALCDAIDTLVRAVTDQAQFRALLGGKFKPNVYNRAMSDLGIVDDREVK